MNARSMLALLFAVALLAGCLPAALQDDTPDAAVVGVAGERGVPGAAAGLDARLRTLDSAHDLVSASSLRFLEQRSGLLGSRALPGAARIARSTGAELAVVIEASTLVREIEDAARGTRETAVLQLEVVLVRAADATELARLAGPRVSGERPLDDERLPALGDDPLIAALLETGLDALAPRVAAELRFLAVSGSTGG